MTEIYGAMKTRNLLLIALIALFPFELCAAEKVRVILTEAQKSYPLTSAVYHLPEKAVSAAVTQILDPSSKLNWRLLPEGTPNIGYSQQNHWFHITIDNQSTYTNWYFYIDYPLISSIDVYEIRGDQVARMYQLGDRFEFKARAFEHRNYVLPLTLASKEAISLYFCIKSNYAIQFPAALIEQSEFVKKQVNSNLVHGLFFGFIVVMLLYNLFLFAATRDISYFYYVCFSASIGVFQLGVLGYGYQYLWSTNIWWQHRVVPLSACLAFCFAATFIQSFLHTKEHLPTYHKLLSLLIVGGILLGVATLVGAHYEVQIINAYLGMLAAGFILATGIASWYSGVTEARYVVLAWFIFLVAIAILAGSKLALWPRTDWIEYGAQLGTSIELALLSLALADRINSSRVQQEDLLQQSSNYQQMAEIANERALELERLGKERLEKSIKSRTEQLQQALQELTQVNRQLEEMSTVDSLTDTKNHSYFLDRLQEEWVRGSREKSSMSLVLVSIDQFQHLADRYGYVAADEVVKLVAGKLIRRVTRPADLVARIDNSEFAVLLPNTDAHGGLFIAEDIYRHIVKEPLNLGVCSLSVSVSIAVCAREPSADSQGTLLLESTQYLLWTVIESGGNRVVLENDIESIGQT
ncbi:MAG: diguanylate cyclase [Pseudomonadales bacterium]|nr:diguanylate cyclase [Pseudomonadales bacterium]